LWNIDKPIYLLKYTGPDPADVRNGNVTVLRLSETYLNAAEAAVKLSNNAKAIAYLDPIVNRANPANNVTGTVTLAQVIKERRKELVGEGHRMFDALRNNETINRIGGWHIGNLIEGVRSYNWDYFHSILPIPKYEMDANPNMEQNEGYSL